MSKSKTGIYKKALSKAYPIILSYLFISLGYGLLMQKSGFAWYWSLLISLLIYTGAFQFLLITFLSSGASLITICLSALLMNSRQTFYSLTFLKDFSSMKHQKLYMIHTLTDETYAVSCTLDQNDPDRKQLMFLIALYARCSWMIGTVAGGIFGQMIPWQLEGIDFCMTALFVIILIDQWEKTKNHFPIFAGLGVGVCCLLIFGSSGFMLPALLITSCMLLLSPSVKPETEKKNMDQKKSDEYGINQNDTDEYLTNEYKTDEFSADKHIRDKYERDGFQTDQRPADELC